MGEPIWTVIVPVKRLDAAKTRLRGALGGVPHELLALALAQDTVAAALSCTRVGRVLVVTGDPTAATALAAIGATIVADPPVAGLNRALARGASVAAGQPVAALTADLPALRPADLAGALSAAGPGHCGVRRFVADTPGTGTVLLTAPAGVPLDPRFGVSSALAHTASGARALVGDWPTLCRDVDTPADLSAAATLGLGPHTAGLIRYRPTPT